ncbi:DUF4174 domain-containing protein [Paracoccus sp. TK19116]|uniref:DUF4174 domain-containing protein n=1 Tax=Paracoccus albicereus TaxID=2922394 RepID=A0ABT1MPV6_9RHOB|nr:DUF4174 domain-containing protein [Paracoccus albicereus]MCQ0970322.1 DUF4174 domain-containing protein [Paracoccus albicereus]
MMTIGRTFTLVAGLAPVLAPAGAARGSEPLTPQVLEEDSLRPLRWQARPVVVLGEGDTARAQIETLQGGSVALSDRDVILFVDGPGAARFRDEVGDGFAVLLIGKDGGVKMSRKQPVTVEDITGLIDTMPMRQREEAEED